jgi:hypothetical protein
MQKFASFADLARDALVAGDKTALADLMDQNFA